jgi:hypothetical protein
LIGPLTVTLDWQRSENPQRSRTVRRGASSR